MIAIVSKRERSSAIIWKHVSAIERSKSSHNASIKHSKPNKNVVMSLSIVEDMANPKAMSSFSFFILTTGKQKKSGFLRPR